MKVNNINNTNFKALVIKPGSQKYFSDFLTSRDKAVLEQAKPMLEKLKKWDLEVTAAGLRIASKQTADAILMEESYLLGKPLNSEVAIKAIYDGYSDTLKRGKYCKFYLQNPDYITANKIYDKYSQLPLVEKSIELVRKFEDQEMQFFSLDVKSYVVNIIKAILGE